jgi:thiamine biosynthesis lipoprotein
MSEYSFRAMGTQVEVWGPSESRHMVMRWFEEVEAVASRFRPDSELSRINGDPSSSVPVSDLMHDLLVAATVARLTTGGLVDIGVGATVEDWGYDRTFPEVRDLERPPATARPGMWDLRDRSLWRTPGTKIDFGGVAKGWACDRAVEAGLAEVVSAGGDMRSAHPDTVASIEDGGGDSVVRVHVGQGGLATSSISKRRWKVAGSEVSHLVDPRTMRPVRTPVVSASVLANTAAQAEAGAKAVLLQGDDGLSWAADVDWIRAAVVIWSDGSVYGTPGLEVAA